MDLLASSAVGHLVAGLRQGDASAEPGVPHTGARLLMEQLRRLVLGRLKGDPAVVRMLATATDGYEANWRTMRRVELALEEATGEDAGFAAELRRVVECIETGPHGTIEYIAFDSRSTCSSAAPPGSSPYPALPRVGEST